MWGQHKAKSLVIVIAFHALYWHGRDYNSIDCGNNKSSVQKQHDICFAFDFYTHFFPLFLLTIHASFFLLSLYTTFSRILVMYHYVPS